MILVMSVTGALMCIVDGQWGMAAVALGIVGFAIASISEIRKMGSSRGKGRINYQRTTVARDHNQTEKKK